jgi:hypothetical protein
VGMNGYEFNAGYGKCSSYGPVFLLWASSSTVETVNPVVVKFCPIKEQKIRDFFVYFAGKNGSNYDGEIKATREALSKIKELQIPKTESFCHIIKQPYNQL